MSKSKFIGEAGEHFVAYQLSRKELYVGITIGNMPDVDLLLSSNKGLSSLSIQVKTSQNAYRRSRYGNEGYEWDVNKSVIDRSSTSFWYAFVDFKGEASSTPDAYIVPSLWISEFVKPDFSRYMYFLPLKAAELTRNRWDYFEKALNQDKEIIEWASKWDEDILIRWGV